MTYIEETSNHYKTYTKPLLAKVEKGWRPESKQDIVDVLAEVQIGYLSCEKVAHILGCDEALVKRVQEGNTSCRAAADILLR
jgi:hypothetical protein